MILKLNNHWNLIKAATCSILPKSSIYQNGILYRDPFQIPYLSFILLIYMSKISNKTCHWTKEGFVEQRILKTTRIVTKNCRKISSLYLNQLWIPKNILNLVNFPSPEGPECRDPCTKICCDRLKSLIILVQYMHCFKTVRNIYLLV